MKLTIYASIFAILLIGIYIVGVNIYAYDKLAEPVIVEKENSTCGADSCTLPSISEAVNGSTVSKENIGVSEKISISVEKKRWYGTIIELGGSEGRNFNNLYLFKKIRIPLNVNGKSLILWDILIPSIIIIIWIIILVIDIILSLTKTERGDYEENEMEMDS